MKKRKKTEIKERSFSVKPFTGLKGFQGEVNTGRKSTVLEKPLPEVSSEEDDAALFRRTVRDVKRLNPAKEAVKAKNAEAPVDRAMQEEEKKVFLKEIEKLHLDVKFLDELPDNVKPLRPLASNRLRELKRGAIRIGLELDLHGLTRGEALSSLEHFVSGAYKRGQNAVLVITGKGNNSQDEPVLQMAVQGWLREKGKGMVAEFAPAPRQLGGSGAFVVFLKEKSVSSAKDEI
jgi:DNA-nicking Smr family endonuclease